MSKLIVTFISGETKTFEPANNNRAVRYQSSGDWLEILDYNVLKGAGLGGKDGFSLNKKLAIYNRAAIVGVNYE